MPIDRSFIRVKAMLVAPNADRTAHLVSANPPTLENPEGFHRFIGGSVELGETHRDAIVREVREELVAEVEDLRLLGTIENIFTIDGEQGHEVVFCYEGRTNPMRGSDPGTMTEIDDVVMPLVWRPFDDGDCTIPLYPEAVRPLLAGLGHATGADVAVDWSTAREANRLNWDDRAALHERSYGIEAYVDDPGRISGQVLADAEVLRNFLPGKQVGGLDLLHLQCHIGTDTISWARLGARVTGVDLSPASLEVARRLSRDAGAEVTWVESDALAARAAVEGEFDVVYTSIGAICWLADLGEWARQIAALLRPGGVFYIQDGHPMLYTLDEHGERPRVLHRYFPNGNSQAWDDPGTYLGDGTVEHQRSYEWPHSLAEIMQALLASGLVIEHFDEGQTLPWRFSDAMVETPDGWVWPTPDRIPCTFTIVARRPLA